ncbi:MAG: FliM/FliN family flagellar motor switch protein [Alphaproteobacteria bacterium]|nr:FliM/FliN family flagellar motor switch protein [Alphaproteobacteria bacterium]MDX5368425.1 FliM/FliN family flagellar motor switch protein [Alphaproteobacteria bacterium]MDX5463220.1 FliM/FliN family flagellar motor switch protein [Alphaproteobacteria bacterium]
MSSTGTTADTLRRKLGMVSDQLAEYPLLPVVLDCMGRRLGGRIGALLGTEAEVKPAAIRVRRYGEAASAFEGPALNCVLSVDGWAASALVRLPAALVEHVVERLLGHSGGPAAQIPEDWSPTPLDRQLAMRFAGLAADAFSLGLTDAAPDAEGPAAHISGADVDIARTAVSRPQTPAILAGFDLTLGDSEEGTRIDLLIPMPMLEPVKQVLRQPWRGDTRPDPGWSETLTRQVARAPLPIEAVLHRVTLPVAALAKLEVGSLVPLEIDRSLPVSLEIDAGDGSGFMPLARGRLGALKGLKGVRLADDGLSAFAQPFAELHDTVEGVAATEAA